MLINLEVSEYEKGTLEEDVARIQFMKPTYQCDVCKQNFKDETNLQSHVRTHEVKFKCSQCDFEVANESDLSSHSEKEHPVKLFGEEQNEEKNEEVNEEKKEEPNVEKGDQELVANLACD